MARVMADAELGGGYTNVNSNINTNTSLNSNGTSKYDSDDPKYQVRYVDAGSESEMSSDNILMTGISGLEDFHEAVKNLAGGANAFGYLGIDSRPITSIDNAAVHARIIGNTFSDVNKTIFKAWYDVESFCSSASALVVSLMQRTAESMELFIRESMYNEKEIIEITTQTNELGNQILNELHASFDTFYNGK